MNHPPMGRVWLVLAEGPRSHPAIVTHPVAVHHAVSMGLSVHEMVPAAWLADAERALSEISQDLKSVSPKYRNRPCISLADAAIAKTRQALMENSDVMQQWSNPCVREAHLEWQARFTAGA